MQMNYFLFPMIQTCICRKPKVDYVDLNLNKAYEHIIFGWLIIKILLLFKKWLRLITKQRWMLELQ